MLDDTVPTRNCVLDVTACGHQAKWELTCMIMHSAMNCGPPEKLETDDATAEICYVIVTGLQNQVRLFLCIISALI